MNLPRRATAELIGAAMLLTAVIGYGIMGERHAPGFILAQFAGAMAATLLFRWFATPLPKAKL